jgi:hypothetical protein
MAITLNPTVSTLGIMAPAVGPWFSDTSITLPVPDATKKLGLTLTLPGGTNILPPATGLMSLYVSSAASPPAAMNTLQDSDGNFPFPDNRLVMFFRLLPEVEVRLHALMGLVPAADASPITVLPTAIGTPSRPQVRSFALVMPASTSLTPTNVAGLLGSGVVLGSTDAEKMASIGLAIAGGHVTNATVPMTWLRRPGGSGSNQDKMLQNLSGAVDFWAFDRRGRAIDPGAVACWWSWLLNSAVGAAGGTLQLLAPSLNAGDYPQDGGQPVVVKFAAQRTLHLVDAHEGPLGDPFIGGRLQSGGSAVATNLMTATGASALALSFQPLTAPASTPPADNPQLDNAPRARIAVLPSGSYGTTASLWPGGAVHAALTRDFVRAGVVEEERHLTGIVRRDSRQSVSNASDRRQSAQNRPSTRINVARTATTGGVLLANGGLVAGAMLALPNAANPTRLVLGIADTVWGRSSATPPAPGAGPLPTILADAGTGTPAAGQYRVQALTGGGALASAPQDVLVEINLGAAGSGAWVRAWPQGFDLATGVHFQITGGGGRADATGLVRLVMVLPNGRVDAAGKLGMDVLALLPGATPPQRTYGDCRFDRPAPLPGAAPTTVSGNWVVCEAGVSGSGGLPAGGVPPGGHVVLTGSPPAIVDRTGLAAANWDAVTLLNKLQATDMASLTSPAYGSTPDRADATGRPLPHAPSAGGDPTGGLGAKLGNRLHRLDRSGLTGVTASSVPYTLLDRFEVAAATSTASAATAVIGTTAPVPWALEPAGDYFHGHPGVPASIETHGAGVSLSGAPAVAVAEYVRERTAGLSFSFVQTLTDPARSIAIQSELAVAAEAATALPVIADGTGPGPVVAVLRTCALGMEGIPGAGLAATASNVFPLSQEVAQFETWLDGLIGAAGGAGTALRSAIGPQSDSISRALDRRIMASAFGAAEALFALLAAIDRAQDFIYLETPAVDLLAINPSGDNASLWQHLISRLNTRKGLRVALCVPTLLLPGAPKMLQAVRDQCLMDAVDAIRAAAPDRFALFSPGAGEGRSIRFASTSVVIDDAFALTGTTHLWRRGLTWDSSLAAAAFDERLIDGRPQDVRGFRIQLLADRLGIAATRVPEDPGELVKAIRALDDRGSDRLSTVPIVRPTQAPANGDIDTWNPDGSISGLSLGSLAASFGAAVALTDVDHAIVEG